MRQCSTPCHHTKNNGDISESTAASTKDKEELEKLRKEANGIDSMGSPYKAIVSVLVLKEGWDVRNVTTIVGLRAYAAPSKILPEQTLGRGLRLMYPDADAREKVSVIGTAAFMDFVESVEKEGVMLERAAMGADGTGRTPLVIEVDKDNPHKNIATLDIEIPVLEPRTYREYGHLEKLDSKTFAHAKMPYKQFDAQQTRNIVFRYMTTEEDSHETELDDTALSDYRSAVGFFSQVIVKDLKLVSVYAVVYEKVKIFVRDDLFEHPVDLEDRNTLRNLSEPSVTKTVIDAFKKEINAMTLRDTGGAAKIQKNMKITGARPFVVKPQDFVVPKKSVFNKIIGDGSLELTFTTFLEQCEDIISYTKNYFAVGFRLDYVNARGDFTHYYPDFLVKKSTGEMYIVETKGREELDLPQKMKRLRQWCLDVNAAQPAVTHGFVYVDEESFHRYNPRSFRALIESFTDFQKP